ncbi:DNA/RNA polymerases superfamily protein [Phytophthora palmivora]|uniref:DNA/RNA polymerases superfamily protein n=1 Tax=Phytophthora palmivora TaxID=4796 RepID=A0A2P4XND3_9STRA|nr:DNA/RNA polymerases superfamily protein [Phytophthora palmivora]
MYETKKTSLYWKGMETQILQFVRKCLCTKSKHPTVKYGKLPTKTVVQWTLLDLTVNQILGNENDRYKYAAS